MSKALPAAAIAGWAANWRNGAGARTTGLTRAAKAARGATAAAGLRVVPDAVAITLP